MQEEKFVLPRFTVPGQRNWAKWALVSVGGLIVVNLIVFGAVLMSRSGAQATAVAPARAEPPATQATAVVARPTPAEPKAAGLPAAKIDEPVTASSKGKAKGKASSRRSRHGHAGSRALASGSRTRSAGGKPDAIDELLKRFK